MNAINKHVISMILITAALTILSFASPATAETVVYSEGFESNDGGYTHRYI